MPLLLRRHSVLPGFNLALGYTLVYLSLIVLIPLSAVFIKTASLSWPAFWEIVTAPRVVASTSCLSAPRCSPLRSTRCSA